MKQVIAMMIGLAILIAAPLSAMAQVSEPSPAPMEPEDPGMMDPFMHYWPEQGGFDYADGFANGTYVDFYLNETTGTITDYTAKLVDYNYYYPMIYAERDGQGGNGYGYGHGSAPEPTEYVIKFFDSITFDGFVANGKPAAFGQSLIFLGENVMMNFGDYEWSSMSFQFGEENGSVAFTVPDGIEISDTPKYYEFYDIQTGDMEGAQPDDWDSGSASETVPAPSGYAIAPMPYQWDEAYLTLGNVSCTIWVDRGTIDIVGNVITIKTYPGASISTSSWIEYAWQYRHMEPWFMEGAPEDDRSTVANAIENGQMAAVGYLYAGDGGDHYSDSRALNDPSFKLEFKNVEQNRFQVQVQSDIKSGRIVALNVNKNALNAESAKDLRVLLDDQKIKACASMDDLVGMQGGDRAGYCMVSGNGQNTVFVYVPSFSTHTITVGLADGLGGVVIPAVLAVGFIAAVVGLALHRGKRDRDEL